MYTVLSALLSLLLVTFSLAVVVMTVPGVSWSHILLSLPALALVFWFDFLGHRPIR